MNVRCKATGFTLVEIIVVIMIIGILCAIGTPLIGRQLQRLSVKECAHKLAADIRHARISAQSEGRRAQLVVTKDGKAHDFNGDGRNELWLTFHDTYPDPNGSYDNGETVISCSSCSEGIVVETGTNPLAECPAGSMGIPNRCMWYSSIGTLGSSATDKRIIFAHGNNPDYKVRVVVISITGHVRLQSCEASGSVKCSRDDDWHDIN